MSVRKIVKRVGVGVLIGQPLIFAAAIFLSVMALFLFLFIYGGPGGV
jgi:hypothetical protein